MNRLNPVFLLTLSLLLTFAASGKSKKQRTGKSYVTLVEAYTQDILPGRKEGKVETTLSFIIEWKSKAYPETFFWRGDNGWMTCKIEKVHKIVGRRANTPEGMEYTIDRVSIDKLTTGDTLMLTPMVGGKFPIPPEIPEKAKNTLFFKAGGSSWLSYPVKNIARKRAIAMP